ncbi:MAG: hypothetical protein QM831_11145 [Kofleriaceae bacterium]
MRYFAFVVFAGCASQAQVQRPRVNPDRLVVVIDAPSDGFAAGYHEELVAVTRQLHDKLASDPHIEVKSAIDACVAVDTGVADLVVQLSVTPKQNATHGFLGSFESCSGSPKNPTCRPAGDATFTSSVTVELAIVTPVMRHGESQHFCQRETSLGTWSSATVEGDDAWKPLVADQLKRAGAWITTSLVLRR